MAAEPVMTLTLGEGPSVGRLGFGAMRVTGPGVWGPPRDKEQAIALLRRVVERGVTFIDTADSYGPGVSETLIAEALHPYPADLVIATKGGLVRPGPDRWNTDCRPEYLRQACTDSPAAAAGRTHHLVPAARRRSSRANRGFGWRTG